MRLVSAVLALCVSLALVSNLLAEEKKPPTKEGKKHAEFVPGMEMLRGLNLTDEQKAKVAEIKKEYGPKFKALAKKRDAIFTAEQKKARDEAVKEAKAAGKKGDDVFKAGHDAIKLTDEQKAKLKEVREERDSLRQAVREKIESLLTADQKEVLKTRREHRRDRRAEGK
ncbi:MAG: hypothetical protein ABFC63_07715 [Thermoguttaceae bacterium]